MRTTTLAACLVASFLGTTALAQDLGPATASLSFAAVDKDGSGGISITELTTFEAGRALSHPELDLRRLDANGDGQLQAGELVPDQQAAARALAFLDSDGNGVVSPAERAAAHDRNAAARATKAAEIGFDPAAAAAQTAAFLDANKDGVISTAERDAAHAANAPLIEALRAQITGAAGS